ncbi:MAG TPA: ketopantoate reductase C-terminal domain-containing protein [Dehalococcoidia bacterium]|nr:ketopantoate reductase C-terminal domain-containing protein [Dehalococcoidia bacterium]MDP7161166.1 ketopantoate reductase C-terminal domain-containing protein [Dehalococcoidia bacterium]MDP7213214.1 ketopantoate reductase C-terminal domain-containing protein [Dehalococcoidia bacterium]MDP7513917.1 ketopantoate reductase C-terminal domain-containing protein [Dehalococcoidia bacterium]HJM54389.1 ketopantoate reductase C-terminal domain-containing protein [Dehalococcoidia bacterium]
MPVARKKIGFIGSGAIACYIGAFLAKDGHDVTLIDGWPEQIDKIKADGISATGPHEPFTQEVRALHIHEAQSLIPGAEFDIGFVAMKAYDTRWAGAFIDRLVKPEGYIVASQNCWTDGALAETVGAHRALGMIMSGISVAVWEPGIVIRGAEKTGRELGHDVFRAGEHDGSITPRTEELAEIMSVVDGSFATDNLFGERWTKLCQNASGNPVQAMTAQGGIEVVSTARGRQITIMLLNECARVGLAAGFNLANIRGVSADTWAGADQGDVYEELDNMLIPGGADGVNWKSSMAQDIAKGRRSETDFMNGFVAETGRKAGVSTPVTDAVIEVMAAIDAKKLDPSPDNIELTLRKAGL